MKIKEKGRGWKTGEDKIDLFSNSPTSPFPLSP